MLITSSEKSRRRFSSQQGVFRAGRASPLAPRTSRIGAAALSAQRASDARKGAAVALAPPARSALVAPSWFFGHDALVARSWDVDAALVHYELARRPVVERTQEAASESAGFFTRVAAYAGAEPIQFAFNLLTRSGRITHASLTVRDPGFTRSLDAWFSGARAGVAPPPYLRQRERRARSCSTGCRRTPPSG